MKTLIATVGGTTQPLIESIKKHKPQYICFICSHESVEKIVEIKSVLQESSNEFSFKDRKILINDVNDLLDCYQEAISTIDQIKEWNVQPGDVVIDYTGGTKNMSVAIALAAIKHGFSFSYIGGSQRTKQGLGVVVDGFEQLREFEDPFVLYAIDEIRSAKEMFNLYQYSAAQKIFAGVLSRNITSKQLRAEIEFLEELCRAYCEWERFAHKEAVLLLKNTLQRMRQYDDLVSNSAYSETITRFQESLEQLQNLQVQSSGFKKLTRLHIVDLIANSERRASEGKYDDAVARLYRALEMEGQISLEEKPLEVSANNVMPDKIPESIREEFIHRYKDDKGKIKLPLRAVFTLLAEVQHPSGLKFKEHEEKLLGILSARNSSILAHGQNPLKEDTYYSLRNTLIAFLDQYQITNFPRVSM